MLETPGVIEGFFGRAWGHRARLDYAPFLQSQGFGYYIYAPKSDRTLRRQWREPISRAALAQLTQLAARYRGCGLEFGIGLTPFGLHTGYTSQARADLRNKVLQLNSTGADILCVQFDDMHGAVAGLAQLQARIAGDVSAWTTAQSILFCPIYYSDDPTLDRVFGPRPANYLQDLAAALDPRIGIFWTGEKVCSSHYIDRHLQQVAERLGRKPFIWDNAIANDGRERCDHLYLDPAAMGWSVHRAAVAGLAINPMNQPTLSRLPLAACVARLANRPTGSSSLNIESLAQSLYGDELGLDLAAARDLFQDRGSTALDAATRGSLIARFRRFEPAPCALEVGGWLRGEYAFDPQCLTD